MSFIRTHNKAIDRRDQKRPRILMFQRPKRTILLERNRNRFVAPAFVCYGLLATVQLVSALNWTQTSAPIRNWQAIASSADGSALVAVANGGGIYTSTNAGADWISNSVPNLNWLSVASSADGTKLVAVPFNTTPYTSTNSGETWITNATVSSDWHWVASSADGNRLFEAGNVGRLAISTNAGFSWSMITNAPQTTWGCVASSTDGSKLVAGANVSGTGGAIYTSADFGATWATNTTVKQTWLSLSSSADGTHLAAVWGGTSIFRSADSGALWTSNSFGSQDFAAIASSADGTVLFAASSSLGGTLYYSTDSGLSWNTNKLSQTGTWKSVAASADGHQLVAAANGGGIWIARTTPNPRLNLALSNTDLTLSWIIPSTNFVPQQSFDLIIWSDLTNVPALNLSTLQNGLILAATNVAGYYRLKVP